MLICFSYVAADFLYAYNISYYTLVLCSILDLINLAANILQYSKEQALVQLI